MSGDFDNLNYSSGNITGTLNTWPPPCVCPTCGRCPTCGQYRTYQYVPYYTYTLNQAGQNQGVIEPDPSLPLGDGMLNSGGQS